MTKPSEIDGYTLHGLRTMAHASGLKGYTVMSKAELYKELFGKQKKEAFSKKETLKAEPVLQPSSTDVVRRRRLRSF